MGVARRRVSLGSASGDDLRGQARCPTPTGPSRTERQGERARLVALPGGQVNRDRRPRLPSQISSFVGREQELSEVVRLLRSHRLVTLTGTLAHDGGNGLPRRLDRAAGWRKPGPVNIERFAGSARWEDRYGYCRVVRAGGWALTAGTTATGPDGVLHPGDPYQQTRAAFGIALAALRSTGVAPDQVVRTRMYVVDMAHQDRVGAAHSELFASIRPVATMVQVSALADPDHLVEVEVEAYTGHGL